MRQIEKKLVENIQRLNDGQSWSESNTVANKEKGIISIYLHGNKIMEIDKNKNKIILSSCGWQTNTTKSRLNALGSFFGFGIYQKKFGWYITKNGKTLDFFDGIVLDL